MRFQSFACAFFFLFSLTNLVAQNRETEPGKQYLTIQEYNLILEQVNTQTSISGVVDEFKPSWAPKAPNVIYIRDPKHTIEVVYWDSSKVGEMVTEDFSKRGTPVYATGLAQVYRGKLQIKIQENKNLSTTPLPDCRVAKEQLPQQDPLNNKKIQWVPFDEIQATQSVASHGRAIVYFRSDNSPICQEMEKNYLLTLQGESLKTNCLYFVNMDKPEGKQMASSMDIHHCPVLLILKPYFKRTSFTVEETTQKQDVLTFLNKDSKASISN